MDSLSSQFIDDTAGVMTAAAADLGALIADSADPSYAAALAGRLGLLRVAAVAAGFSEVARLADEAQAPLRRAVEGRRAMDRISMQAVGWAMQALNAALSKPILAAPVAAAA